MPRVFNIFRNVAIVLSLLLFISTIAIWIRTQRAAHSLSFVSSQTASDPHESRVLALVANRDALGFIFGRITFPAQYASSEIREIFPQPGFKHESLPPSSLNLATGSNSFWGFAYQTEEQRIPLDPFRTKQAAADGTMQIRSTILALPWWCLAVIFAIAPAVALNRLRKKRRHKPGHCRKCGYDLRATPDRCPECGVIPEVNP